MTRPRRRASRAPGTVIAAAITSQPQRAGFPLTLELRSGLNEIVG